MAPLTLIITVSNSVVMLRVAVMVTLLTVSKSLDPIVLRAAEGRPHVFVDASGRERLFHGTNAVTKGPPWYPDYKSFSVDISMAEEDFQWMQKLGLNMLRLGMMWPGVEPVRGEYNVTYLDEIEAVVNLAAKYGVWTLLDMHQDGLSEYFCGEGLPTWAVMQTNRTDFHGEKAFPAPFDHFDNATDFYIATELPGSPRLPNRHACATRNTGPGWHEVTKQSSNAYQALWNNVNGTADALAAMWAHVAKRFKGQPNVLGLELVNEPFAGDLWADPLIMIPRPYHKNADKVNLQPTYDRINRAVRTVNPNILIFFGGVTWGDLGAGFDAAPGGNTWANKSVLAFHFYKPPQVSAPLQFEVQSAEAKRLGTAMFLTETGDVDGSGDSADTTLTSWSAWEWKSFCREQGGNVSQNGVWGACKTGIGPQWTNNEPPMQVSYARTYAQAVAGTTTSMNFNTTDNSFTLAYTTTSLQSTTTTKTTTTTTTDIYVFPKRYPMGVQIIATATSGTVNATYDGDTRVSVVTDGVAVGTNITVKLSPKTMHY